ncbi:TPA: insecticidal delta-endotoxin Cry8Ea1 family protein [Bacillus toyonensis]
MNKNSFQCDLIIYPKFPYHNTYVQEQTQSILSSRISAQFRNACESDDALSLNTLRSAIITVSGIVWAIAGFIPVYGQAIAAAGGVVNVLLPVLWQEDSTAEKQKLMCEVGSLINEKISQYAFAAATAYLEGLQRLLTVYNQTVKDWKDPNNKKSIYKAAEDVREMFREVHSHFIVAMPMFKIEGFEVQLLPIYAEAATTHLILLQDVVKFGSQYGFDPKTIQSFYQYLVTSTEEYTDHCIATYTMGLEKARKLNVNLEDREKYPWMNGPLKDFQGIANWNHFNEFRRNMTLLVMDLVATWPTLNPLLYPKPSKIQISRELYTDIQGTDITGIFQNSAVTLESIERDFVRKPQLITSLKQIELFYDTFDYNGTRLKKLNGIRQQYLYSASDTVNENLFGYSNKRLCVGSSSSIWQTKIAITSRPDIFNIDSIEFSGEKGTGKCTLNNFPDSFNYVFSNTIPSEVKKTNPMPTLENIPKHNLCWLQGGKSTNQDSKFIDYIGCVWNHPSIDSKNMISSKHITQIAFVTAQKISAETTIVKGPGSTGGNLVKLQPHSHLFIAVNVPAGTQSYNIRIRCANKEKGSIFLTASEYPYRIYFDIPDNLNYQDKLNYQSFQLVKPSSNFLIESSTTADKKMLFYIESSNIEVILDKLEFIPV